MEEHETETSYQAIFDAANDAIFVHEMETARIIDANRAACEMFCYPKEEITLLTGYDLCAEDPPYTHEKLKGLIDKVIAGEPQLFEWIAKDGAGRPFWIEMNFKRAVIGGKYRMLAIVRDITDRKHSEEVILRRDYQLEILSRASQHINAVLEIPAVMRTLIASAMEVVDADGGMGGLLADGKIVFKEYNQKGKVLPVNYTFERGRGIPGMVLDTMKPHYTNDAEHDASVMPEIREAFGVYNLANVPILNQKGEILGCFEIHNKKDNVPFDSQDIFMLQGLAAVAAVAINNAELLAERKAAERELKESERFLSNIFTSIQDGISILDKEMRIMRVNPAMEKWYSYAMPLVGKKCYEAYHCRSRPCAVCPTQKTLKTGKSAYEVVPKREAGGKISGWFDLYSFPLVDSETGKLTGVIEYVRDITDRKAAEEKTGLLNRELIRSNKRLKELALRDLQTGLYNHNYLEDIIEVEFYRARRHVHPLSVTMIDIDYFKSINDVYGHAFGDTVLIQFAKQLKRMVRRYDTIVRFGGEEFLIVSSGMSRADSLNSAHRLIDAISLYQFGTRKCSVKIKVSMAVASYPDDKISKGMDLINLATKILEKAKEDGGDRVYSYLDMKKKAKAVSFESMRKSKVVTYLEGKIEKLTKGGRRGLVESIFAFAKTIELKDHYTGEHTEKTVHYATEIAKALHLSREEIESIKEAAVLHDLGKIGVSEKILLKKGKLTRKEFEIIKNHPQIGADILRPIHFMHDIIPLILYHHERWDGKGYPIGLKREEIPIGARVIAIADVYQALTSNRPYRKAYSKDKAVKIIKDGAGIQFDPKVVSVFLEILKKGR